ncbi:hypothetical protein QS26_20890 [Salmonella enterica subsp. enterica serovar Havana]|nr:hypothetical protein QS26_20890 [Salmonella enterica subsp. enterica serovar Havana]KNM18629.1 hypothetical protein AEU85_00960 [Salmonella enterica subsp. enterica serovar Worthington]KNM64665.1 hypothetical protein AEU99_15560 [Salmonella enterica subsp. enterica serovar Worthington]KNO57784.1 hypothetical protein AEV48_17090 [Salmonella enterica subsp. enterica serovar Worthington]KNW72076.1 hypothetical protein AEX29_16845 [Salmonella enterica subsp. enterica serovar Worthington]
MMFDLLRPVASANLTTDLSGSGHSSISLFASSCSSHRTRLFLTDGILITGAFSSHFQSRSAARRMAFISARCFAFVDVVTSLAE